MGDPQTYDSPENHDYGDPSGWVELLDHNIGRNFKGCVSDKEHLCPELATYSILVVQAWVVYHQADVELR